MRRHGGGGSADRGENAAAAAGGCREEVEVADEDAEIARPPSRHRPQVSTPCRHSVDLTVWLGFFFLLVNGFAYRVVDFKLLYRPLILFHFIRVAAVTLLQRVERQGAFLSLAAKELDELKAGSGSGNESESGSEGITAADARHATDIAGEQG